MLVQSRGHCTSAFFVSRLTSDLDQNLIYSRQFQSFHTQFMTQANNPLHGITLETIVTDLVDHYGWEELGERINIRCFTHDPSIKSSLKFLRKTQWARDKVEYLYLKTHKLPLPKPRRAPDFQEKPTSSKSSDSSNNSSQVNADIWGKR